MPEETEEGSLFGKRDRRPNAEDLRHEKKPKSLRRTVRNREGAAVNVSAAYRRVFANAEHAAQHGPVRQIVKDGKPVEE